MSFLWPWTWCNKTKLSSCLTTKQQQKLPLWVQSLKMCRTELVVAWDCAFKKHVRSHSHYPWSRLEYDSVTGWVLCHESMPLCVESQINLIQYCWNIKLQILHSIILNHPFLTWGSSADPFIIVIHKLASEQYLQIDYVCFRWKTKKIS